MPEPTSRMRTALERMSAEELTELLADVPGLADAAQGHGPLTTRWPWAPARARPLGLAELARLLASPAGTDFTLVGLDRFTLQLAQLALWHGGSLSRPQALRHTGGEHGPDLDRAAHRLRRLHLAEDGGAWLTLTRQTAGLLPPPGICARDWFAHDPSDDLARMLANLGVPRVPARKPERLDLLIAVLRDPDAIAALLDGMPDDTRRVFARLCAHGLHALPDLGIPYLHEFAFPPRRPSLIDWLLDRGLVGVDYDQQVCFVWLDVVVALNGGQLFRTWEPAPPAAEPRPVSEGLARVPPAAERLGALLELWAAEPADALAAGGLGVRPIRAAAKRLGLDAGEAGLLVHLAIRLGLLGTVEVGVKGRGRTATPVRQWGPTPLCAAWRDEPAAHRWLRLVQAWRDDPYHDEAEGLPERSDGPRPSGAQAAAPLARAALLDLLAGLPAGTGLDDDDLVAVAGWHRSHLLFEHRARGLLAAARALGLVPPTGPAGLTVAGRASLAGAQALAEALPPGRRELVVQADLTVITPPDADADLCAELARYAECESDAGARVWRLSERRITAALDAGTDPDAVVGFLRGHATADLPQNVAYLLADVAGRHGRVRAGAVSSYLRCDDAALLSRAVAVKPAKLRLLAPTAAVSSLPRDKLVAALRDRGVNVTPEDADGAAVVDARPKPADPVAGAGLPPLPQPVDRRALAVRLVETREPAPAERAPRTRA